MEVSSGTHFAQLLMRAFDAMVDEVRASLEQAGHAGLTVANELAMQAIDGGASSAAGLAREMGVTRQAAAKTISTLEVLGYVRRDSNPDDARQKTLHVTAEGRSAIAIGAAAFDRIFHQWQQANEQASRTTIAALQQLAASHQP